MTVARERFFDAVVIVGDFERAEVEFADVGGGRADIRVRIRGT